VDSGPYPIRGGNEVVPLVDGEPAFRRICEAVEAARQSVWLTVAFIERDVQMPDGRGSFFDVLDRAVANGIDVRVIFWRSRELETVDPGTHFSGTDEERGWLTSRGSRFLARWDRCPKLYCQHQKSWLIDAGTSNEVAFVGGINLGQASVVRPGHPPDAAGNIHDVYLQLAGPAATDVHHNFVQRWNETSDRGEADGHWPDASSSSNLVFPTQLSAEAGPAAVQIQRTVRRGQYSDSTATPGGQPFAIENGDSSIVDQYLKAIDAAERTIYIEDQAIGHQPTVNALHAALERGVEVVFLVPADPNSGMIEARKNPESKPFFDSIARLGRFDHFTLAGIASEDGRNIYVHAKIALIDDTWATIGSTNIANRSFYGDTELNASFWHGPTVRALRCELLLEHLGRDTAEMADVEAMRVYRQVASENAARRSRNESQTAPAFELDPATYAL
jgi:phosphatidylserine/phosphatidylglycerophosphate/cardiolipin synthase-like enzyme